MTLAASWHVVDPCSGGSGPGIYGDSYRILTMVNWTLLVTVRYMVIVSMITIVAIIGYIEPLPTVVLPELTYPTCTQLSCRTPKFKW